jgi:hypothetical protein
MTGDAIITSKCKLANDLGFLVASETGLAWFLHVSGRTAFKMDRTNIWNWWSWSVITDITEENSGQILFKSKLYDKKGHPKMDKEGNQKLKKSRLTLLRNKDEEEAHFRQRQLDFADILTEIYNRNKEYLVGEEFFRANLELIKKFSDEEAVKFLRAGLRIPETTSDEQIIRSRKVVLSSIEKRDKEIKRGVELHSLFKQIKRGLENG